MIIAGRPINPQQRPFIIAEVAQTHDGSLGNAFAFIDVAKECGADAIKFQTHIACEESTPAEPWRVHFSRQDATRSDYWRRIEFSKDQWRELKYYADERGIIFLSSPFSIMACEWLEEIGMPAWKLASGEVHNSQLVDWVASSGKPVIISTGLSTPAETRTLVDKLLGQGIDLALLHCTTRYPTPAEDVGINLFEELLRDFTGIPIGLSDHSGTTSPAIVASYLGASIIEIHLTMHPRMFGPDVSSSLTPSQLAELVRSSEFAWQMRNHRVDKDRQLDVLTKERNIFGRSLVAVREILKGELIHESDMAYKKPGGGFLYEERHLVIGRRATITIKKNELLRGGHVE